MGFLKHMLCAVYGYIRPHLNRQYRLANHVARMRADDAAAKDFGVAVGFRAVVNGQLGHAFVAAVCILAA